MGSTISIKRSVVAAVLCASVSACVSGGKAPPRDLALLQPVPQIEVTSRFGLRRPGRPHKGIDFAAPIGTPVMAVRSGRVTFSGQMRGFGNIVIIDHGADIDTYYAHLSSFAVSRGDRVGAGQVIGLVGETGNATGPHLHFELRYRGEAVDPEPYLGR